MRNIFQDVYPEAFDGADQICIRSLPCWKRSHRQNAFHRNGSWRISKRGVGVWDAFYFENTEDIIDFLAKGAKSGDVILVMSNAG